MVDTDVILKKRCEMGRLEKTFIVVNIALIVLYVLFLVIINLPMLQYGKKYEITSPSYNENIDSIVFINENVMVTTLKMLYLLVKE